MVLLTMILSPLETHTDETILQSFLFCLKRKTHKPSNVAVAKNFFPNVYTIGTTCFNECFSLHVMTGRHYFL